MNRNISFWVFATVVLVVGYFQWQNHSDFSKSSQYEIRGALDIGSGATKLKVAQVDLKTNKIVKILLEKSVAIPFQDQLDHSSDMKFTAKIMEHGITAFKKLKADALAAGAKRVIAVATQAFRKAKNASDYVKDVKEQTGIDVLILTQDQEGKIAFRGAVALCVDACFETAVVWDIGGGSYQFTTENENEELIVSKGTFASVGFKNYIIGEVQGKNSEEISTPNPITLGQAETAEAYVKKYTAEIDPYIKQKLQDKNRFIIGVGGVFMFGIKPYLQANKNDPDIITMTRGELNELIKEFLDSDDSLVLQKAQGLIGANNSIPSISVKIAPSYIAATVSNFIYVEGFMEALGIEKMHIMEINNADGALTTPGLWNSVNR